MILFGAGGHGKSIINVAHSINLEIKRIYDDNPFTDKICDIPVMKYAVGTILEKQPWIIGIGCNRARKVVREKLFGNFGTLIHKTASISKWSQIGSGSVIMANAVVNTDAIIGEQCIINSGAIVEHDCILGDYAHISPNVSLAGAVTVGEGAHIGTGASIIPGITIGKWATIGAGTVIIRDVPDGALVVGNPGRIVLKKEQRPIRHASMPQIVALRRNTTYTYKNPNFPPHDFPRPVNE